MLLLRKKRWLIIVIVALLLVAGSFWLLTTDHNLIWPVRNTLQYRLLSWWWGQVGPPGAGQPGTLRGTVRDEQGQPVAGATILVSEWDGTTHSSRSNQAGLYTISGIPAGSYRPVAGAPGHGNVVLGTFSWKVQIEAGVETTLDVKLPPAAPAPVPPGQNLTIGEPEPVTCTKPIESTATRRQISFDSAGQQPNQQTFLYTPVAISPTVWLPTLLTVYPSQADGWECASLPLAEAGYAVIAIGPAYSLDLERDVDELEQLVDFARSGLFPHTDGSRMALLGGSYSGLHELRLLQRDQQFDAVVLLGAPVDIFDMRRRQEEGSFIPPYDLDQVMIALGLPDRTPLRYWQYSGAYHARPDWPPLLIMHSRSDEIIPYQQSELLADRLTEIGVAYEIHLFEGAEHYLLAEGNDALAMFQITLDFLVEYLQ